MTCFAQMRSIFGLGFLLPLVVATLALSQSFTTTLDRSPVDLAVSHDGDWVAVINQSTGSITLMEGRTGEILDEKRCGRCPVAIAISPDGTDLAVTCSESGEVTLWTVSGEKLELVASIPIGFEPQGVTFTHDGSYLYVARFANNDVVKVNLTRHEIEDTVRVGRWPRYLALSPNGQRLAVGTSGDSGISIVDTAAFTLEYVEATGLNIGHLVTSSNNQYVYSPWMIYRSNPITPGNIRRGWVLGSRLARVRLDGAARREAITLDPPGKAVADPHGIALTSDEQTLVVSASGTHELLIYHLPEMPFVDFGGPGDHIDKKLLSDTRLFTRIPLGGRPMGIRISPHDDRVYIANYLLNAIQVVDLNSRKLLYSYSLGGPETPSLARRGEAIFFDAQYSLDQWYSCHTCHYDGGTNSVTIDTLNDETIDTFKTVLPLRNVAQTSPWTWHGWQQDLHAAIRKSVTSTMCGSTPSDDDVTALVAFLKSLEESNNPFRQSTDRDLADKVRRGKQVFEGSKANCIQCHSGPFFTDGEIHEVGLWKKGDRFKGFNTPSLRGVFRKTLLLHDGRAESLIELLSGPHNPETVSGSDPLTEQELQDLATYLKTL